MHRGSKRPSSSGAAMIELVIVLPVMLLLFLATVEFGRIFSAITWFHQNSYHAQLASMQVATGIRQSIAKSTFAELNEINQPIKNSLENLSVTNVSEVNGIVTTQTVADLRSILLYRPLSVHSTLAAADLTAGPSPLNLGTFANSDSGTCFHCDRTAYMGPCVPEINCAFDPLTAPPTTTQPLPPPSLCSGPNGTSIDCGYVPVISLKLP